LRLGAFVILAAALVSCSGPPSPAAALIPSTPAKSQAGDLRTRLDLLLGEHVMIVAKESAAAVNHTDDYGAYAALLATNSSDMTRLLSRAFGNTTAGQIAKAWNTQNGYLVDYTIAVVTHDDAKAKAAMLTLTGEFVPQFAQLLGDASDLSIDTVKQLASRQVSADKAFIDDVFAHRYGSLYSDLNNAYTKAANLGDKLSIQIATRFPDKFPGDPTRPEVVTRVSLNLLLHEHSYLSTMATAAAVAGRNPEAVAASNALAVNRDAIANSIGPSFVDVWTARDKALFGYAAGDSAARSALTSTFVDAFTSLTHTAKPPVIDQVEATLRVIDDQRARSSKQVADDDRAAATAMQPIADSIR